jgi:hypothetical protein
MQQNKLDRLSLAIIFSPGRGRVDKKSQDNEHYGKANKKVYRGETV